MSSTSSVSGISNFANFANFASFATIPAPASAHAKAADVGSKIAAWGPEVKRILCVRADGLGDVLMSGPAIAALKRAAPGRHLTLLASVAGAQASRFVPEIDEVIAFDLPWAWRDHASSSAATVELRNRLAAGGYDAAVIFTVYSQNPMAPALLCYMAGIRRRLGYCRENPYALLNDWVPETEPENHVRHEVERQLDLVAKVGATALSKADRRMRFSLAPDDFRGLEQALDTYGVARGDVTSRNRWIVVHPGASVASRRYPPERFAKIATALAKKTGMQVLITGTRQEAELAHQVHSAAQAASSRGDAQIIDLSGRLSLGELGALIDHAALLVSNNSGPVHIAAALGTPVIDLYALTNPQQGPWDTPHRLMTNDVPCRWCYKSTCPEGHHLCLLGIEPETVVDQALDLLAETGSDRRPTENAPLYRSGSR